MPKLAKLPSRKLWSRRIWESLVDYVNTPGGQGKLAPQQIRSFQTILHRCMNWIGGVDEDIAECMDLKGGTSLNDLEVRYRADIRRVLAWLVAPTRDEGSAAKAVRFLSSHGTGIKMDINANTNFKADADEPLLMEWPESCESVIAPVCKFILDQIERHDIGGETMSDLIPVGQCERTRCDRFFMIERAERKRFCDDKCRAGARQDKLTKEQKAARMRKYRTTIKELLRKPVRFPKKKSHSLSGASRKAGPWGQ